MVAWKTGLSGILDVVAAAKKKSGGAAPAPAAGGVAAVFAELNRGEEVTKGLRKVDKSEMTHKNPALRAGSTVPSSSTPGRFASCRYTRELGYSQRS